MIKIHENDGYQKLIEELEDMAFEFKDESTLLAKLHELESIAIFRNDPILKAVVSYHRSDIPYKNLDMDTTRKIMFETIQLCKENNMQYYIMRCYNTLAIIDSEQADYHSSITHYLHAFHIAQTHPDYQYSCIFLNNIGNLFVWLNEHNKALDYLLEAYDAYYAEHKDNTYIISIIILNIVEEYSILEQYDKVAYWSQIDITLDQNVSDTIDIILETNEIRELYLKQKLQEAHLRIEKLCQTAEKEDNFIYVFRSYLRLLDFSIRHKDKASADILIQKTEIMNQASVIISFRYDYVLLKYLYYKSFVADLPPETASLFLSEYVESSRNVINQMQNTYTRRLIIESELMKTKHEKEMAISESQKLRKDIELDYFTGILNKISFEKYVNEEIKNCSKGTKQALFFIDIDHFKDVNDTYGHDKGDELILKAVESISSLCRKDMLFARFGGDEFLLFIKNVRHKRFIHAFAQEIVEEGRRIPITDKQTLTFSVGFYILNGETNFKDILPKADKALYITKKNGRNGFSFYEE